MINCVRPKRAGRKPFDFQPLGNQFAARKERRMDEGEKRKRSGQKTSKNKTLFHEGSEVEWMITF